MHYKLQKINPKKDIIKKFYFSRTIQKLGSEQQQVNLLSVEIKDKYFYTTHQVCSKKKNISLIL